MDIKSKLKEKFSAVNDAFFEKEANMNFLRVEVKFKDLNEVVNISKEISDYLDQIDKSDNEYYLDVYSSGTDQEIKVEDLKNNISESVQVELNKAIKTHMEFIGELLEANDEEIIVKWNAKGQFRKQVIAIDNIKVIRKYSQIKR